MSVRPFRIDVSNEVLSDLKTRLSQTRFPDEVVGSGWDYGTDLEYMKELLEYWLHRYDWRKQEKYLNTFPHFKTDVDGFNIHFIHVRGTGPAPIPIILTHGWPSSFVEMLRIIPMLTDPESYGGRKSESFDVVVPSVPGYGFSSKPTAPGYIPTHDLWARLMTDCLGYERFAAHGGDIGAGITTRLAHFHPEKLLGISLLAVANPYLDDTTLPLTNAEQKYFEHNVEWDRTEGGYSAIQSTKPQTLAYGLNDSPIGLAAWIVEKFRSWSDCHGDIESRFSKDEILNNIMVYWVGQTISSSVRYYFEGARHPWPIQKGERIWTPTAAVIFPKDLALPPRELFERTYNLQRYSLLPRGGHFGAHEEPLLLANELRYFFFRRRPDVLNPPT